MSRPIPVSRPVLIGNEQVYVSEALRTGWISSAGKYIPAFEKAFSEFVSAREGIACCNGTASVYLALRAAGVGTGDRVVVPSFTMMASVFPIVMLGAVPVFVDCEQETWNMDPDCLASVQGPVKAIMVVHLYGHPCDMDRIQDFANAHKAIVIEDAAEAHGAIYKGRKVGSLSEIAAFSFFANKIITTGEGGMVTTSDQGLAEKARYYRNLCFDKDPEKRFVHAEVGFNYRMTNIQAAIGLAQTEHADELVELRRAMAQKYLSRLKGLSDFIQLPVEKPWAKNVYWMFGLVLTKAARMNALAATKAMAALDIETRRFFCPAHMQPCLSAYASGVRAPVSEYLWDFGFYLPSSADLTDDEADRVVDGLKKVLLK